jgi:predicted permease
MNPLRSPFVRLRNLFRKEQLDRELNAEMVAHLELHVADNLRSGMTPEEARRNALLKLGGVEQTKESVRDRRGIPFLATVLQDLRFALRMLRKSPGFTMVAVLTLALGIGATTSIFSVVSAVLLRPLPFPNNDLLVRIQETHPGSTNANLTDASYLDLQRESKSLTNTSAFRDWSFNLTGEAEPERVSGTWVSGSFFLALGVQPFLGRTIRAEDDQPGADNHVVVLSHALWQNRYGADPAILGKSLRISAENYRVLGVMPKGFDFPNKSKLWCPLVPGGELRSNRRAHLLSAIANLRPGVPPANAQGEMTALAEWMEKQNPGIDPDLLLTSVPLKKSLVAPVRPALLVLIFAVALLLLIACANLANLLLARAAARHREFAIRAAVGAGPARLARQLLTESIVLALLGALLGLAIASQSLRFIAALNAESMPRFEEVNMDWRALGFTFLVSLLTGLLVGLLPALDSVKTDVTTSLKKGGRASTRFTPRGSNPALVIPQFALAVVLLVGAGLLANSFVRLLRVDPGFNQNGRLTMGLFLSSSDSPQADARNSVILQQMLESVRGVKGLRSASLVNALPITGGPNTDFAIVGRPVPPANDEPSADIRTVDSAYFQTMGIPLLAGREFTETDNATSARVMVINQTMARQFWPTENPVGHRVTMKDWGPPLTGEIVGVVGDIKTNGLDAAVGPMIYWPYPQFPQLFNTIVVHSDGDPLRLIPALKAAIWAVDRNQPISDVETLDHILSESVATRRLYMILLGVFSAAALLLAAVGIYGIVSYSVSQRIHEMGIRLAVGAERIDVLLLILKQGTRLALIGIATGIVVTLLLTRLMSHLLFGVSPTDPLTFALVAILLTLVTILACYIPARRATRVDPMVALRYE